jgi:hypothetical protein
VDEDPFDDRLPGGGTGTLEGPARAPESGAAAFEPEAAARLL